jgi:hypothetical protein
VDLKEALPLDDPTQVPKLEEYGELMGKKILNDQYDRALGVTPELPAARRAIPV